MWTVEAIWVYGKCDDLKDSIYNIVMGGDTFAQTTKEIAEFVARKYKDAGKFQKGMVEMHLPNMIEEPDTPDQTAMSMEIKLLEMNLKEYKKKGQSTLHKLGSSVCTAAYAMFASHAYTRSKFVQCALTFFLVFF